MGDNDGFSVFPLAPVEVLWIIVVTSCFPAMGLGQEKAQSDILDLPPSNTIFTWEVIIDMFVYGVWMAACCLSCFLVILYGKGDGELGSDCNTGSGDQCKLVFQSRSGAFAAFTWCALILAWECIHLRNSLFYMRPDSENPWWKQTAIDYGITNSFSGRLFLDLELCFRWCISQSLMTRCFCMDLLVTNGELPLHSLWRF